MAREYFKAFHSYLKAIQPLDDAERGRLFTALLSYSMTGEKPQFSGNEQFVFPLIQDQIDRDVETYNKAAAIHASCGKKGGRPKNQTKPNITKHNQNGYSKTNLVQDKDKEEDKDNITTSAKPPKEFAPDSKAYKCAVYLAKHIIGRLGGKPKEEKTLQQWADAFDKVNRIDGFAWDEIAEVLAFSQQDSFWQQNILSGEKFRKQYAALKARWQREGDK
jgi:hypothetical protein